MDDRLLYLIRGKKRLMVPAFVLALLFYFMLPLSLIFFPEVMNRPSFVMGLTWAWLYAFLQIPMTWFMGWFYHVISKRFERQMEEIIQEELL
ncbi:DUF485 domain-containing protein [Oceanobacillus bengalensis]|uniref:DUF485 domain-containing protein n=1 Tax=Oceanobacillus bengalensis TaxID=1435466 RepID=A0A494Z941_9BACI|nr:DUF485 domain-containing protein [Oceanobacillus bengalensis]